MKRLVSNQISPNFRFLDSLHAAGQLFQWRAKTVDFEPFFQTPNYRLTNAARSALGILIDTLKLPKEKKIGIPAYICAVVATPFLERGYRIQWIDTDKNGLIDPYDFEKKADHLSLVVVPHIWGQYAPREKIYTTAKQKNIFVIEDCAHLWDTDLSHCDAKILSFGREKVFSCVSGGALLWREELAFSEKLHSAKLKPPSPWWTIRHALQPLWFSLALPFWHVGSIGKVFVWSLRKLNILPAAVTQKEKKGHEDFPICSMPRSMQYILVHQLDRAAKIQSHRQEIASAWKHVLENLFPKSQIVIPENALRVILRISEAGEVKRKAKALGFYLRDWDGHPIAPEGIDRGRFGYHTGQCPNAEDFNKHSITFPTNIRTHLSDVRRFETMWKILYS